MVHGRGLSYAKRNDAVNALVAEVEVDKTSGEVRVRRFYVASDHGQIVNRKAIKTTIEGNLIMALSRTLFEEVEFDREMVRSEDWATYPILEMEHVPQEIIIEMIDRPELGPRGAGEPTTRLVPGAVANAVFDATGVRVRKVPLAPTHPGRPRGKLTNLWGTGIDLSSASRCVLSGSRSTIRRVTAAIVVVHRGPQRPGVELTRRCRSDGATIRCAASGSFAWRAIGHKPPRTSEVLSQSLGQRKPLILHSASQRS